MIVKLGCALSIKTQYLQCDQAQHPEALMLWLVYPGDHAPRQVRATFATVRDSVQSWVYPSSQICISKKYRWVPPHKRLVNWPGTSRLP